MARPYSVRFMIGRGGHRIETYTVPVGKRAVVRSIAFTHWGDVSQNSYLKVHGILVFQLTATGALAAINREVRFTAYARETISVLIEGGDVSYGIDGYLLADQDDTPDDADNVITPVLVNRPGQWAA